MLETLKEFVRQIVKNLQERTEPLSNAVKERLTSVLSLVADKMEQLKVAEEPLETPIVQSSFAVPQSEELLWILSGGNEEAFVQYLTTFPDDDFLPLLRNPEKLQSRIEDLQAQNLISERGEAGGIPQADLQSSNIFGYQYNPQSNSLKVRFQGGSEYEYTGVPNFIYNIFKNGAIPAKTSGSNKHGQWWIGKNPSLGAAFHELIKLGGYPYQKLT